MVARLLTNVKCYLYGILSTRIKGPEKQVNAYIPMTWSGSEARKSAHENSNDWGNSTAWKVKTASRKTGVPGTRQPRFYDFNVYNHEKVNEKLDYMHANPVIGEFGGASERLALE